MSLFVRTASPKVKKKKPFWPRNYGHTFERKHKPTAWLMGSMPPPKIRSPHFWSIRNLPGTILSGRWSVQKRKNPWLSLLILGKIGSQSFIGTGDNRVEARSGKHSGFPDVSPANDVRTGILSHHIVPLGDHCKPIQRSHAIYWYGGQLGGGTEWKSLEFSELFPPPIRSA